VVRHSNLEPAQEGVRRIGTHHCSMGNPLKLSKGAPACGVPVARYVCVLYDTLLNEYARICCARKRRTLVCRGKKKTKMLAVLPYRVLFPTAGPGPQIQDRRGESGALIWAALSLPKTYGLHVLTGRLSFALSCIIGVSVKQQESGGR